MAAHGGGAGANSRVEDAPGIFDIRRHAWDVAAPNPFASVMGISPEQVQEIIGQGQQAPSGHIPFTPRAKKVLELSLREALQLGHNYIGTEHILLGLIREGGGAAQLLAGAGEQDPAQAALATNYFSLREADAEIAKFTGAKHALAVSSGSTAVSAMLAGSDSTSESVMAIGALAALCAHSAGAAAIYVSEPNPARRARAGKRDRRFRSRSSRRTKSATAPTRRAAPWRSCSTGSNGRPRSRRPAVPVTCSKRPASDRTL